MHIFFSGIGGTGIGPLALIAKQAGYTVSGSDKQDSQYIAYLRRHGLSNIHIGQTAEAIARVHEATPIDWFVYSSALRGENPNHPELQYVEAASIKYSKRDELLNHILRDKQLKLIAIAGTHGKTTTTAMVVWLFKELGLPLSYSVGAKLNFGEMGRFDQDSKYFVYECDEFDRNFLAFEPYLSLITGVTWDHHEIYPTREDYQQAFRDFIDQSDHTLIWQEDLDYLGLTDKDKLSVQDPTKATNERIHLPGLYNRLDAWLAVQAVHRATDTPISELLNIVSRFPGSNRRMELIIDNLYTDYAHTPEKIVAAMSVAVEMAAPRGQKVVVVYEPLTNRRMHYMASQHLDVFAGASQIYWVPSYLAREDPSLAVLSPSELIKHLNPGLQAIAQPMELNESLSKVILGHLDRGDMVVAMSGGGGGGLDEWLRKEFAP